MRVIQIVPPQFLQEWRRQAPQSGGEVQPITLKGLVARLLQAGAVVYREDWVLETVAVWEAVDRCHAHLEFFAPIAHFPGFVQEVQWLIRELDHGELNMDELPEGVRLEIEALHTAYHDLLGQYGVLDSAGQIRQALALMDQVTILDKVEEIELVGLSELTALEREFTKRLTTGRKVVCRTTSRQAQSISVTGALDPQVEVEEIALAIRNQLAAGIGPGQIGVAFPDPRAYTAHLIPIFNKWGIPWKLPVPSIADLALGKAIMALLTGEIEGWHKNHLQLLMAPGWGLPVTLTSEEQRALRLAPPLEGLPAWQEYLGKYPGWQMVLDHLRSLAELFPTQSLRAHARSLRKFMNSFPPETWPAADIYHRAEILKSWDALQYVLDDLELAAGESSLERFAQLLKFLMENYQVNPPRTLADKITVLPIAQLGAANFRSLHVGGLVQGAFPKVGRRHWLTKAQASDDAEALYKLITSAGQEVFLYYPETDHEGKLNLPSAVIPPAQRHSRGWVGGAVSECTSNGNRTGILADERVLEEIRASILAKGLTTSQLNMYARCPYQFFCALILNLKPWEEETLELSPLDEGNIVHLILQQFWTTHKHGVLPTIDEGQGEIERLLREHYGKLSHPVPNRMLKMMRRFIRRDLELAYAGWRPTHLEREFRGLKIAVPGGYGEVELRGIIDRIDVGPDGSYVLYDYKTGSAPTPKDVRTGGDIQIASYLLAAQELLPKAENVGVAYYHTPTAKRVGIFRADFTGQLLLRKTENCLEEEAFAEQLGLFEEIIQDMLGRIFMGEFPPESASSRTCSYCAYQGISRREVGMG
jgi:RecB family exonuclease